MYQFPATVPTVHLAQGSVFIDALAAGSLTDGPVLLVEQCALPSEVKTALGTFKPDKVVALGGTGAVCDAVLQAAALAARP